MFTSDRRPAATAARSASSPMAERAFGPLTAAGSAESVGEPLGRSERSFFEPRFGHAFGDVRVHAGSAAASAARGVQARAYTLGRDIVFGAGEYAPESAAGRRLLAHELAHVVQGRRNGGAPQTLRRVVSPDYVVDEAHEGRTPAGSPLRVFFPRDSFAIPQTQQMKIDIFKVPPFRSTNVTLHGLATEDELAVRPTLPNDRATAVATELTRPFLGTTAHAGTRAIRLGTLANTSQALNLRFQRAVEILVPGALTMSPANPPAAATVCSQPLESAFQAAKQLADKWIDDTRPEVQARPTAIATEMDRFFGNHSGPTLRRVDHNLGLIKTEVGSLAQPANHICASPGLPGCVGASASNTNGIMTICAGYTSRTPEERARNLVHEAGHSTAGLRVTGSANAPLTRDFAYRSERLVAMLGAVNPDQALSNSDSYAMFLMTRRASGAITPRDLPTSDPAPTGFANARDSRNTARAVALAEVWIRLAAQALRDLHLELRDIGVGSPVPSTLHPRRLRLILRETIRRFPPILTGTNIDADDLLMIAGVRDRYQELERLMEQPISTSTGAATALTAPTPATLSLAVSPAFLRAGERVRARTVVDKLIELLPTSQIRVALRPSYGAFAEFVRNLPQ